MFGPVIRDYHRALVEEIARRVGLTWTQRQAIPAHFTLKYWFSAPPDGEIERVLDAFAATHARTAVRVGGLGHFDRDVLFVEVTLSEPARRTLGELLAMLRALPWMSWDPRDGDNLHPHMTIAERCGDRFDQAERSDSRASVLGDERPLLRMSGSTLRSRRRSSSGANP